MRGVFVCRLASHATGGFGRGLQACQGDVLAAVGARTVSARCHPIQGFLQGIELGDFQFRHRQCELARGGDLGMRVLRVAKLFRCRFDAAAGAFALLDNASEQRLLALAQLRCQRHDVFILHPKAFLSMTHHAPQPSASL